MNDWIWNFILNWYNFVLVNDDWIYWNISQKNWMIFHNVCLHPFTITDDIIRKEQNIKTKFYWSYSNITYFFGAYIAWSFFIQTFKWFILPVPCVLLAWAFFAHFPFWMWYEREPQRRQIVWLLLWRLPNDGVPAPMLKKKDQSRKLTAVIRNDRANANKQWKFEGTKKPCFCFHPLRHFILHIHWVLLLCFV